MEKKKLIAMKREENENNAETDQRKIGVCRLRENKSCKKMKTTNREISQRRNDEKGVRRKRRRERKSVEIIRAWLQRRLQEGNENGA